MAEPVNKQPPPPSVCRQRSASIPVSPDSLLGGRPNDGVCPLGAYAQANLLPVDSPRLSPGGRLPRSAPELTAPDPPPAPPSGRSPTAAVRNYELLARRFSESLSTAEPGPRRRRQRVVSPHHYRSLSFRTMRRRSPQPPPRPEEEFRPRVATMPSEPDGHMPRRRTRSSLRDRTRSPSPTPPPMDDDNDDTFTMIRNFTLTSKGCVVNRGDLVRQRSRSNNSVASTASSVGGASSCSSGPRGGVPHRVHVLGAVGVGKTALVTQFMTSEYMNAYDSSQDEDLEKTVSVLLDGKEYELQLIDPVVMTDPMLTDDPSQEADAFLIVYSVTDRSTFEKAVDLLFSLREKGLTVSKAVILVGNKTDLVRSRVMSIEEGRSVACTYECKFIETSAGLNHQVDELLVGVVTQIRLKAQQQAEMKEFASPTASRRSRRRGSLRSTYKARGLLNRVLGKGSLKSKSCDNLYVL